MKALWLCNCPLSDSENGGIGTWLAPMAQGLLNSAEVEMAFIATGPVKTFTRHDYRNSAQWLVPKNAARGRDGLLAPSLIRRIVAAVEAFSPDLVHVWGTESFWGLLPARGILRPPALLEMQGLKRECARVYFGGLRLGERLGCVGIKELLKRRTMADDRRDFARWGRFEMEIIRGHRFVDVQSPWVVAYVRDLNPSTRLFPVDLALRSEFHTAEAWQPPGRPVIFCSAAYSAPFKGLHVAIRALARLRQRIPGARLRVAGAHQRAGFHQEGYVRWLNRLVRRLGLAGAIDWLGPLSAGQIVEELRHAAVMAIPTFAETYCAAFAEAMAVGTPTVASYVGGMPSLGRDEDSCLFFPAGDVAICAHQLERVLTDEEFSWRLSRGARRSAGNRHDLERIVGRQLEIYRRVLGAERTVS